VSEVVAVEQMGQRKIPPPVLPPAGEPLSSQCCWPMPTGSFCNWLDVATFPFGERDWNRLGVVLAFPSEHQRVQLSGYVNFVGITRDAPEVSTMGAATDLGLF
jgi:hypothetical protein